MNCEHWENFIKKYFIVFGAANTVTVGHAGSPYRSVAIYVSLVLHEI